MSFKFKGITTTASHLSPKHAEMTATLATIVGIIRDNHADMNKSRERQGLPAFTRVSDVLQQLKNKETPQSKAFREREGISWNSFRNAVVKTSGSNDIKELASKTNEEIVQAADRASLTTLYADKLNKAVESAASHDLQGYNVYAAKAVVNSFLETGNTSSLKRLAREYPSEFKDIYDEIFEASGRDGKFEDNEYTLHNTAQVADEPGDILKDIELSTYRVSNPKPEVKEEEVQKEKEQNVCMII